MNVVFPTLTFKLYNVPTFNVPTFNLLTLQPSNAKTYRRPRNASLVQFLLAVGQVLPVSFLPGAFVRRLPCSPSPAGCRSCFLSRLGTNKLVASRLSRQLVSPDSRCLPSGYPVQLPVGVCR